MKEHIRDVHRVLDQLSIPHFCSVIAEGDFVRIPNTAKLDDKVTELLRDTGFRFHRSYKDQLCFKHTAGKSTEGGYEVPKTGCKRHSINFSVLKDKHDDMDDVMLAEYTSDGACEKARCGQGIREDMGWEVDR